MSNCWAEVLWRSNEGKEIILSEMLALLHWLVKSLDFNKVQGENVEKKMQKERCVYLDVSLNGGIKKNKMIIFSRKTHGCWVPPF